MKYNTEEKKLVMPEYGRNIQNMVDYCITIQDREERKRCADTIINIMGNMFPMMLIIVSAQRLRSSLSWMVMQ